MRQSGAAKSDQFERQWRLGRHRGKYAVIWYSECGKHRTRISTGTDDKGLAESRAGQIWNAHHKPLSGRLEDLWPVYEASRRIEIANPENLKYAWIALKPHFAHRLGKAITRDDCRAYYAARKAQGKSDSTARTELQMLRACLNFHYKAAAPAIWLPPPSKPRSHWLTKDDVARILDGTEAPHARLFIILAVTTAARMSAILDLTWDRVNFIDRTIDYMPPGRHKTNKGRTVVPINDRALEALQQAYAARQTEFVIEYGKKPVKNVRKTLKNAGDRAGVHCSAHVFRHTAGVWMAQANVPMEKISQYMAHSTVTVTERHYARYSPSYMRDASDALNW